MRNRPLKYGMIILWLIVSIMNAPTFARSADEPENTDTAVTDGRNQPAPETESPQFLDLPLEKLLEIEIFSTSRSNQRPHEIASAIFVVTSEDIRRSGATSIPEALRAVPGLQVTRFDSNKWNVGIRGFNWLLSNKLLVMIDGRSIYSPEFSGVWWDIQDTIMEDVDRIEIIRGPGASLWGANAVNGVINIITKQASKTRGTLVSGALGHNEKSLVARQGFALGAVNDLRLFIKGFQRNTADALPGGEDSGIWRNNQAGFRLDGSAGGQDTYTLQGSISNEHSGNAPSLLPLSLTSGMTLARDEQKMEGGYVLGRWKHSYKNYGSIVLQSYVDILNRSLQDSGYREKIRTVDVDFQHNFDVLDWNHVTWGMGYRNNDLDSTSSFRLAMTPRHRNDNLWSMFLQDEIMLLDDRLRITLGSKFEHNDATGFEVQPSLRALWMFNGKQSVWGAVSRSVRTPSWLEQDGRANLMITPASPPFVPYPVVTTLEGSTSTRSEELISWEAGYRNQINRELTIDLAGFFNRYNHLNGTTDVNRCGNTLTASPSLETIYGVPSLACHNVVNNKESATTYGLELSSTWQPVGYWRLNTGYTWFNIKLNNHADTREKVDPHHQVFIRSGHDLHRTVTFDWTLRYVDASPGMKINDPYVTLDLRLAWKPASWIELALIGRNLTDENHKESAAMPGQPQVALPVSRDFFGTLKLEF